MCEFFSNPTNWVSIIFSIITVVVAVVALFQTQRQIKLSNKQQLFDRRLKSYLIIKDLVNGYKYNKKRIESIDLKHPISKEYKNIIIMCFFNNNYFNSLNEKLPIECYKENFRKTLMDKIQDLQTKKEELKFIFSFKQVNIIENFLEIYINTIINIYIYDAGLVYFDSQLSESQKRQLITNSLNQLKESYDKLMQENILDKLSKEIKL